jgi:serine/threonine-protein kinase
LRLYDFVRKSDRMWLVLEYVDGWSLQELLGLRKSFPSSSACAIALEMTSALEHAHERGIVHRDVQPKNVLVSRNADVKLVSFSVAVGDKLPTAPELLDGGSRFGGPMYMSPEQILGEAPDPRSDLFSVGVILYQMLSGKYPFEAPDERSVTQRIRHDPAPSLSREQDSIPASLERLVARCLHKLPGDRFHDAKELGAALSAVIDELGGGAERALIASSLMSAGLVKNAIAVPTEGTKAALPRLPGPVLPRATRGLSVCFAAIVLGGAFIQYFAAQHEDDGRARGTSADLPLVPRQAGYLRVVADPWADVIVDGQKLETTPFARPIPLVPGTHYVRLEHPNAATERRTIRLVAGETILLDVKMRLDNFAPAAVTDDTRLLEAPSDASSDAPHSP